MALTTLKSLNAEIKQLEAQKKLVEKRDGEVPKALAVLQRYAKVLSPAQRRQVAKIAGKTVEVQSGRATAAPRGPMKGRKLGSVAPKYRLPTGETWTGRGLSPKVFTVWAKSAEGRAWAKANPDAKFPTAETPERPIGKPPQKAVKAAKGAVKKALKKSEKRGPAKRGVKKIAGAIASKAMK